MKHANISILVPESSGKYTHQFRSDLLHQELYDKPFGENSDGKSFDKTYEPIEVIPGKYYTIYLRDDGDIGRAGAELMLDFSEYDKALNLISAGNIYNISNNIISFYAEHGISWDKCSPVVNSKLGDKEMKASIQYLWKDGSWFYRDREGKDIWITVENALTAHTESLKKSKVSK